MSRARYKTTKRADNDIIEIYVRGVREFGFPQAERYHQRLIEVFELLALNPRMAAGRKDFEPTVRLHPYGSHLVFYRIEEHGILIVRVLHNRQDWISHL